MVASLPDTVIAARLAETKICKNCGGPMPAWIWQPKKRKVAAGTKMTLVRRNNEFCSTVCSAFFRWNDPSYENWRAKHKQMPGVLAAGQMMRNAAAAWHRSEEGRKSKKGRKHRKMIRPDEQIAAVSLASNMVVNLSSAIGRIVAAPDIAIKVDRRLLMDRKGARNHNSQKTVRLTDSKVFDCARQAATESGGSPAGVSTSVRTGSIHKGHQFMRYEEWIAAGKPDNHPLSHERKPVSAAETVRRKTRLTEWLRSEQGRDFQRARMSGSENPSRRRVIRLSDRKVFNSMREAVIEIDGHGRGLWAAIRKGWLHRNEQWMAEDEWIATGRPSQHPRRKVTLG